jgi:hypothetical protein
MYRYVIRTITQVSIPKTGTPPITILSKIDIQPRVDALPPATIALHTALKEWIGWNELPLISSLIDILISRDTVVLVHHLALINNWIDIHLYCESHGEDGQQVVIENKVDETRRMCISIQMYDDVPTVMAITLSGPNSEVDSDLHTIARLIEV